MSAAKAPFSCARAWQHKVRRSWTHHPSLHTSKLGSHIPDPSQTSLLRIALKHSRSRHSAVCSRPRPVRKRHRWACGDAQPGQGPASTAHTGDGAAPAPEQSLCRFYEGTGASRTGFSRRSGNPSAPRGGLRRSRRRARARPEAAPRQIPAAGESCAAPRSRGLPGT